MITLFSFIMAFFWSSLMILIVSFLRNRLKISLKIDTILLISLYIACMIRFFIPFEFAFVKEIGVNSLYTNFIEFLTIDIYYFSILEFLLISCVVAILIKLVLFCKRYLTETKLYINSSTISTKREYEILKNIKRDLNSNIKIQVLYTDQINSPITFGIFKKTILLPSVLFSDQDLYYILLHEYMHHHNKDLLIKMLTNIFCIIFWWNPFVYLLNKNLDETLELKCDLSITSKMSNAEKGNYLEVIKNFVNNGYENSKKTNATVSFGMAQNSLKSFTKERFIAVATSNQSNIRNKILSITTSIFFISSFILSYIFVVQPAYIPSNEDLELEEVFSSITNDTSFIIDNKDGTYTVFSNNEPIWTIDDYVLIDEMLTSGSFALIEE